MKYRINISSDTSIIWKTSIFNTSPFNFVWISCFITIRKKVMYGTTATCFYCFFSDQVFEQVFILWHNLEKKQDTAECSLISVEEKFKVVEIYIHLSHPHKPNQSKVFTFCCLLLILNKVLEILLIPYRNTVIHVEMVAPSIQSIGNEIPPE